MLSKEDIRDELMTDLGAIVADTPEIADDDNLLALGLESLPTMRLLGGWIKRGYRVSFGSFMRHPTIGDWSRMLAEAGPVDTVDAEDCVERGDDAPLSPVEETVAPVRDDEPFDLTDVQYAYWIGRARSLELGGVGTHGYVEIETGDLDIDRLRASWDTILRAHPMLRACYTDDGRQHVLAEPADATVEVHDLSGLDERSRGAALDEMRERLTHRLLPIDQGRVACLQVSRLSQDRMIIHFDIDLLVCDVQSFQIILRDLAHHYRTGQAPDVDASWSFARYLARKSQEDAERIEHDREYWRERLSDLPSGPRLPQRTGADVGADPRFVRREHSFDARSWEALQQFCEAHGTTPAMVLLTAYARTIGQWSENKRFLLTVPLFDRDPEPGIENVVADFTTLTLASIDQTEPRDLLEDLSAVQEAFYEDVAHSRYSAVRVLRDLRTQREDPVLTPVVFSCNLGVPLVDDEFVDTFGQIGHMISQTPQVSIDLQVFSTTDGFMIICDAVEQLFPDGMLEDFFGALVAEISRAVSDGTTFRAPVDSPGALMRRQEREEIPTWQLPDTTLVAEVLAAAERSPDAPAVRAAGGGAITYRELVARARAVATSLVDRGVARGQLTGVMVSRGPDQVIGALGVMMAGSAYVPIGSRQPPERVAAIVSSPQVAHLLTDRDDGESADLPVEVIGLDDAYEGARGVTLPRLDPQDAAYVIYTSGTSGTPKGVQVSHGAAWNTIAEVNRRTGIGGQDRGLGVSSFDFDLSVHDAFGLLAAGAELVTIPEAAHRDAEAWLELVETAGITVWNSVPTLFEMLLAAAGGHPAPLSSLRHVLLSGDWIDVGLPARMRSVMPHAHMMAMGGATEAAVWSNALEVGEVPPDWVSIPYGRPLARQAYRVVDGDGRDCPDYVPGELWIGGLGVATCYVDDPALSEQKFVTSEGTRWYRTGDMGRFWHDGTIEFLGRTDNQVKLRGHRIELGEIEAACEAVLPIERAVCVARQGRTTRSLAAFLRFAPLTALGREAAEWPEITLDPTLTDPQVREAIDEDETLQRTYALATMRRWEAELAATDGAERLSALRRTWQDWLATAQDEESEPDPGSVDTARLERFVAPFERAFLHGDSGAAPATTPTVAEFLEDPQVEPIEEFLASRPLGRLVHEVLREVIGQLTRGRQGSSRILELGARRPEESADYRRVAVPGSYVLADRSRHHLDLADQRVPGEFEQHHLQVPGAAAGASDGRGRTRADLVVCNQTLHQGEDVEATLQEVRSLIAPRGLLVFMERTSPSPLADVSATFLAGRHRDLRAQSGSMLLSSSQWDDALQRTGWNVLDRREVTDTMLLVVAARTGIDEPTALPTNEYDRAVEQLSARVPEYMIPKQIVEVPRFPLTGNGKVDRTALEALLPEETEEDEGCAQAPATATERQLVEIWEGLLGIAASADSDYFRSGGDSLMATKLRRAVEDRFQIEFGLETVFDAPVLRDMAALIDDAAAGTGDGGGLPPIEHGPDQFAPFPLTDVQQSYLIGGSGAVELGEVSSHCYFEMATPALDPDRLESSLNVVLERHPMLRTVVCEDGLSQQVLPQVPHYDLVRHRGIREMGAQQVAATRREMEHQRFDPTRWPCFDIRYAQWEDGGRLFLSFDNLFLDGWSMFHVFREWKQVYEHGAGALTEALPYSFKDYVEASVHLSRSETHAKDLAYWESSLESIHPAPQLPVSRLDQADSSQFLRHEALVPEEQWRTLQSRIRAEGLTDAVVLSEVYAEVLARYSEQPGLSLNLTQFDRTRFAPEVDAIVGDFTSLSILSVDTRCAATFRDRAKALQQRMFRNLDHASVSGVQVERMLNRQRRAQVTMPVVFTCGLGVVDDSEGTDGPYLGVIDHGLSQTPQVWMDLQVHERDGGLMLTMDAVEAIFPSGMVEEM
ncbi:MAG: amino acid adenylation domain-containing protein, partial [Brachybacterium sp.]